MNDVTLHGLLETVWQHLGRGTADRRHPARHPSLATIGRDGPEIRTLVLRGADRGAARLELHTDTLSPKCDHIRSDPRVGLHVWLPKPRLQIRMRAQATLSAGDPAVFENLPAVAQANYGGAVPGTPSPAESGAGAGDAARFCRIICDIRQIDALLLDDPHRRAVFTAADGWRGMWVAP